MAPQARRRLRRVAYPLQRHRRGAARPLPPAKSARPRLRPQLPVQWPPHRAAGADRAMAGALPPPSVPLRRRARPRPGRGASGRPQGQGCGDRGRRPHCPRDGPCRPRQRRPADRRRALVASRDQSAPRGDPRRPRPAPDAPASGAYRGEPRAPACPRARAHGCNRRRDLLRGPNLRGPAAARLAGPPAGPAAGRQPGGPRRPALHGDRDRAGRGGGDGDFAGTGGCAPGLPRRHGEQA